MENLNKTDNFLAKWAEGELSDQQQEVFMTDEDRKYYEAILEGTDLMELPSYNKDQSFEKIKERIANENNEKKVVRLIPKWVYAVAAAVVCILGYTFLFNQGVNYETGFGEQLTIALPDSSEVILNAKSKLTYKKKNWENGERKVYLEGEGFFKVEKGSDFIVVSDNAAVSVLGTQFTVTSNKAAFQVVCYEGKVKVEKGKLSNILTRGQAVGVMNESVENWIVNDDKPSWIAGESSFINTPIHHVIFALENQYDIKLNSDKIKSNLRFTGSFSHENLEIALRTVFDSMEIEYSFVDEDQVDLVEKK